MKVTNYEEYDDVLQVTVENDNEKLHFEYRFDFQETGNCILIDYYKDNGDGTEIVVRGSYNNDFLYCKNKNSYRTIYIDEDGCVYGDTIKYNEEDKMKEFQNINLLGRVDLKDYLASSPKLFANGEEIFNNDILGDEHFKRFLELDNKYSKIIGYTLMDTELEHQELCKKICKKVENRINNIN